MPCAPASAQTPFVDDAGRRVELPARVERVFSAGAPAEVLLYTLAPEKLAGRNMQPSPAALELFPPQLREMRAITSLPDRDDPRYDAELLALDVDVYVDYGTVDEDSRASRMYTAGSAPRSNLARLRAAGP
jgi:iron complex transport system substrate-binding protein